MTEKVDLLITGGKIVDATGYPWFHGDVAISGDKVLGFPAGLVRFIRTGGAL